MRQLEQQQESKEVRSRGGKGQTRKGWLYVLSSGAESLFERQWGVIDNVRGVSWSGLDERGIAAGKGWRERCSFTEMLRA